MKRGFLAAILAVLALAGSACADAEPDTSMRTWLYGEYLLWWLSTSPTPQPLLTTGSASPALGRTGTQVLAGGDNNLFNSGPSSGYRVGGGWLNTANTFGIEGSYFQLAQHATTRDFGSGTSGSPVLGRPIFDTATGVEDVLFVSSPGAFRGSINFASTTSLLGADANLMFPTVRGNRDDDVLHYFNLLAGGRYLSLNDELDIAQTTTVLPLGRSAFGGLAIPPGSTLSIQDQFRTHNQFYGGQVGAQFGLVWWRFCLNATGKVAVGGINEFATINGSTNVTGPNNLNRTLPGGLLALSSNSGSYSRDMPAVIPEGQMWLSFEITPQIRLIAGWTVLYVSNVARPGNLIDRGVNPAEVPSSVSFNPSVAGPARPAFNWNSTDFSAQGLNVGLSLRF